MSIKNICLLKNNTDRTINYLSSIDKPCKDLCYYFYKMTQVKQNKVAINTFKPIKITECMNMDTGCELAYEVINGIELQLIEHIPTNATKMFLTALQSPFLDLNTKLKVCQEALKDNLSSFQIEELLALIEQYKHKFEEFFTLYPDDTLTLWFINQINILSIMLNLNLLTKKGAYLLLKLCYKGLPSHFSQSINKEEVTYLCHWLFNGMNNIKKPSSTSPLTLVARCLLHEKTLMTYQHPYLRSIKSEWLKSCLSEDHDFTNHIMEGGSPQKYLLQKYKISRPAFKHLNRRYFQVSLNTNAILFSMLLSKLPMSHWPHTPEDFDLFCYRLALISWMPVRMKAQALIILKKHPKIELIQLEKILIENERILSLAYPYMSSAELDSILLIFYNRTNDIMLAANINDIAINNSEVVESLSFLTIMDNSESFGFQINQLRPNLFCLFSREWQNCLNKYLARTSLGLSKIFLVTFIKTHEAYLLEVCLNVEGKPTAVQMKDAKNECAPFGVVLPVQQWLNTQEAKFDRSIIPKSLLNRVQVIVDKSVGDLITTKLNF